jgi:ribosomal protein S18 acetylase RimI-like enzyme
MTIITFAYEASQHPHLRRFDIRKDLKAVADLIELCFAGSLDADGRRYVRQMRSAARHTRLLQLTAGMAEQGTAPFSGFVWEQEGQIIGNASHIAMTAHGKKVYLIANVAVHPDYRRRGIARALTEAALDYSQKNQATATWLHVREDNPAAFHLYQKMGFTPRTKRTNWQMKGKPDSPTPSPSLSVGPRRREHWPKHLQWLNQLHPPELDWYLPLNVNHLRPGLRGFIHRLFSSSSIRQWAVTHQGRLWGVVSWHRSLASADRLWLAADPEHETDAILGLIPKVRQYLPTHRSLNLEYPAGRAAEAFEKTGFSPQQTLIWMEHEK